jgi:hypothetical protein
MGITLIVLMTSSLKMSCSSRSLVYAWTFVGGTLCSILSAGQSNLAAEPPNQYLIFSFSNVSTTGFSFNFRAADVSPDGYLVIRKRNSSVFGLPVDGTQYTPGTMLIDGDSIIYVGPGTSIVETALSHGTKYNYAVFTYNGTGSSTNYLTATVYANVASMTTASLTPVALAASSIETHQFTANWQASRGATGYEILLSAVKDFSTTLVLRETTNNAFTFGGLDANGIYYYIVRANYVGGGPTAWSNQIAVQTLASTGSDIIQITEFSVEDFPYGQSPAKVRAVVSGAPTTKTIKLFYRPISSTAPPLSISMLRDQPSTSGPIPTVVGFNDRIPIEGFDDIGSEVYITAYQGNLGTESVTSPKRYVYRTFSAETANAIPSIVRFGGTVESYQIISIPYELSSSMITDIFEPTLGPYNKHNWRLIRYQDGKNTEYKDGISNIEVGKGYWFNSAKEVSIKPTAGKSPAYTQSNSFSIQLEKGWNQIATPYPFKIDWDDLLAANGNPSGVGAYKIFNPGTLGFENNNSLNPYEGGFVFTDQVVSLSVPIVLRNTAGGRVGGSNLAADLDQEDWFFPLRVVQGDAVTEGGIGMRADANLSKDRWDDLATPRFVQFLELNFYHPEFFWPRFNKDIVPTGTNHEWPVTIETNGSGRVELRWDASSIANAHAGLFLFDEASARLIDMKRTSSLPIDNTAKKELKIIYAHDGKFTTDRHWVGDSWPNPAKSQVTVPVMVSNTSELNEVAVDVFSPQGARIRSLGGGVYASGAQSFVWDTLDSNGVRVADGLYIIKVKVNGQYLPEIGKLIVNRTH